MNDLQIFKNDEFGKMRSTLINNEPWIAGLDVAKALGYKNTKDALIKHVDDEDKQIIQRSQFATFENHLPKDVFPFEFVNGEIPNRGLTFINESGVYSLILSSKLPSARRFKHWVTSEVLPAIRKNGGYIDGQETMSDAELMAKALMVAQNTIENKNKEIERMRPKEIFADAVTTSKNSILVGELAKILKQNGINIGQNRLFEWMKDKGYLIKRKGSDRNMPTQRSMEMGLFEIKETIIAHSDGHTTVNKTPKVTGKGQSYFINLFLGQYQEERD